jgi:hypothetical protein
MFLKKRSTNCLVVGEKMLQEKENKHTKKEQEEEIKKINGTSR